MGLEHGDSAGVTGNFSLSSLWVSEESEVFSPHKCGLVQSGMTKVMEPELGQTTSSGARCTNSLSCSVCHIVQRPSGVAPASGLCLSVAFLPHSNWLQKVTVQSQKYCGWREETAANPNPCAWAAPPDTCELVLKRHLWVKKASAHQTYSLWAPESWGSSLNGGHIQSGKLYIIIYFWLKILYIW